MDYVDITMNNLQEICEECANYNTPNCLKANCNVGFSITMMEYMKGGKVKIVKNGLSLLPKEDTKYYDENKIARSIASICKLCKGCNEHHTELCTISLARKSIEGTVLKEILPYSGNALVYFINVAKQNKNFSDQIMEVFRELQ